MILTMINLLLIVVGIFIAAALGLHFAPAFAMHDSTLDVNTWSATDNSTQRHTIDLNQGAQSSAAAGASTTPEETTNESTEDPSTEGNGDETTGSDGNEGEDGNGDDGNSGED